MTRTHAAHEAARAAEQAPVPGKAPPDPHARLDPAPALLTLQRTHGNAFVRRALAEGGGEAQLDPAIEAAIEGERGRGRPLDPGGRARMEQALGADLSGVRVHADETAAELSSALDANAFTVGSDVFFGRGQYDPDSSRGRGLLAHELTHVLQQGGGRRAKLRVGDPDDAYERQAEAVARAVVERERAPQAAERQAAVPAALLRVDEAERVLSVQRQQATTGTRVAVGAGIGAVVGGTIGAIVGSIVPGIGTLIGAGVGAGIGAIVGGLVGYFAGLRVSFARVRAASTPAAMGPDRIPPRVNTPVAVSIAGYDPTQPPITISVAGNGGANGNVTVDGAATRDLTGSATVQLNATTQTAPGNAGNLRLEARQGGTLHAQSNAFSVAAIPENWTVAFQALIDTVDSVGMRVTNSWVSDSGNLADLDQVQRSESVEPKSATGVFNMGASNVSGYLPATGGALTDSHSTPRAWATGVGVRVVQQTFKFRDARTGAVDVPARNSGYRITRTFSAGGAGPSGFQLVTDKSPAAGTANGITSTAGAGGANSGLQDV